MRWHDKYKELETSSKFHEAFREFLLTDSFFSRVKAFQEVPVSDLAPRYPFNHYIDWYLETYGLVVELHGIQHYKPAGFGGVSMREKISNLASNKKRDSLKKDALLQAGYDYLEIPYTQKNFKELLMEAICQKK